LFKVKHQELVEFDVAEVLKVSINLVSPAIVLEFVAHPVYLLVVLLRILRIRLVVAIADLSLSYFQRDLGIFFDFKFETGSSQVSPNTNQMVPIIERQCQVLLGEFDSFQRHQQASVVLLTRLEVQLVNLKRGLLSQNADSDHRVLSLYLIAITDIVQQR
jgi:hypothetical protein